MRPWASLPGMIQCRGWSEATAFQIAAAARAESAENMSGVTFFTTARNAPEVEL